MLVPAVGFYELVNVLDFASLYPSIMLANTLDSAVLITDPAMRADRSIPQMRVRVSDKQEVAFAVGFDESCVIPQILRRILMLRKSIRKKMKTVSAGSFQWHLLNHRQKAVKCLVNSVYGYEGLRCKGVAAATTALGRHMLCACVRFCEGGYSSLGVVDVVYGDTDSVFVHIDPKRCPPGTRDWGAILGQELSNLFRDDVVMESEAVIANAIFSPLKKLYMGWQSEDPLDVRGSGAPYLKGRLTSPTRTGIVRKLVSAMRAIVVDFDHSDQSEKGRARRLIEPLRLTLANLCASARNPRNPTVPLCDVTLMKRYNPLSKTKMVVNCAVEELHARNTMVRVVHGEDVPHVIVVRPGKSKSDCGQHIALVDPDVAPIDYLYYMGDMLDVLKLFHVVWRPFPDMRVEVDGLLDGAKKNLTDCKEHEITRARRRAPSSLESYFRRVQRSSSSRSSAATTTTTTATPSSSCSATNTTLAATEKEEELAIATASAVAERTATMMRQKKKNKCDDDVVGGGGGEMQPSFLASIQNLQRQKKMKRTGTGRVAMAAAEVVGTKNVAVEKQQPPPKVQQQQRQQQQQQCVGPSFGKRVGEGGAAIRGSGGSGGSGGGGRGGGGKVSKNKKKSSTPPQQQASQSPNTFLASVMAMQTKKKKCSSSPLPPPPLLSTSISTSTAATTPLDFDACAQRKRPRQCDGGGEVAGTRGGGGGGDGMSLVHRAAKRIAANGVQINAAHIITDHMLHQ